MREFILILIELIEKNKKNHHFSNLMKKIKVVAVGDSNTNKTAFIRILSNGYNDYHESIGYEFVSARVDVDDESHEVHIWDTSGQERFKSIAKAYLRGASGAFLMYNPAIRSTFDSLPNHIKFIKEIAEPKIIIMLIANKVNPDDPIEVSNEEGQSFAEKNGLLFGNVLLLPEDIDVCECLHRLVYKIVKSDVAEQEKQEKQEKPKSKIFSFFRGGKKSGNDNHHDEQKTEEKSINKNKQKTEEKTVNKNKEKTEEKEDEKITFSITDFNKILERFIFLENHLSKYEDIQTFNFNTFKCEKLEKKEENFYIDDDIESNHEIFKELEESKNYKFYKIV